MTGNPVLFQLDDQANYLGRAPWCSPLVAPVKAEPCSACGRKREFFEGTGSAVIEGGGCWTDMVGSTAGGPPFLLSERVIEVLRENRIPGFTEFPVDIHEIRSRSKLLAANDPPRYYYLRIEGLADLDFRASGMDSVDQCQTCFKMNKRSSPLRFAFVEKDLDDVGFVAPRNFPSGFVFCGRRILELAREHRWSNLRFVPSGVLRKDSYDWQGVDYLGKQWPPKMEPD